MRIEIRSRLHPFFHVPGNFCLVPKTRWVLQAFPTRLYFRHIESEEEILVPLPFQGPVHGFTVELDLEKSAVHLFGRYTSGFVRLLIRGEERQMVVFHKKEKIHSFPILTDTYDSLHAGERLSLGSHRKQDWELVQRRSDLTEILPVWLRLGMITPLTKRIAATGGTPLLLDALEESIAEGKKLDVEERLLRLFQAGFQGMLVPRLQDTQFQGIVPEGSSAKGTSPLLLLSQGARCIRSLFLQEKGDRIAFLPVLPPSFHAGRYLGLVTQAGDQINLEWSKKLLFRCIIRCHKTRTVIFKLQKDLEGFRVRVDGDKRGKAHLADEPFTMQAGCVYYFDRFQK